MRPVDDGAAPPLDRRDVAEVLGAARLDWSDIDLSILGTLLVIHHSRKDGGAERGSSALKGVLDVMIRCESLGEAPVKGVLDVMIRCESLGEAPVKGVLLKCMEVKDGEPFGEFCADLESVTLPDGETLPVLAPPTDFLAQLRSGTAEKISELLRTEFAETGATHGMLRKAFVAANLGSESTFNRAWKFVKESQDITRKEINRKILFFSSI